MEDGIDAFHIKKLMRHAMIKSTSFHVHLTNLNTLNVKRPMEKWMG